MANKKEPFDRIRRIDKMICNIIIDLEDTSGRTPETLCLRGALDLLVAANLIINNSDGRMDELVHNALVRCDDNLSCVKDRFYAKKLVKGMSDIKPVKPMNPGGDLKRAVARRKKTHKDK